MDNSTDIETFCFSSCAKIQLILANAQDDSEAREKAVYFTQLLTAWFSSLGKRGRVADKEARGEKPASLVTQSEQVKTLIVQMKLFVLQSCKRL